MKKTIQILVLKNALDFKGKANPKAVLGLILKENPELKKDVPMVLKQIEKSVQEVSKLSEKEIKSHLIKLAPELLKEKKKEVVKGPLKALRNAEEGKVVVRIAPSPSGALHIGHAYGSSLNALYSQMYKGKFILRIEDTNPENIYPKAYELIEQDARWLTEGKITKIIIQSDRLDIYYGYAEKLVNENKAYVCICPADEWREMKNKGVSCPCRNLNKNEQQQRYNKMFSTYAEGEAILRLKTDINHKNPAMRDFGLMRINEHIHPRTSTKKRVWPLMVFSVAIDDHELGLTHVLNGKDQADNAHKEKLIMDCFGWQPPEYQHWGFINFIGFKMSASETRRAIEQNEYHGWEDIRLPFLPALRKRGYQPGAFKKFASEIGLSLNDKTVSVEEFWKMINAFNKEIIEPISNRYFFVNEPVAIQVINAPKKVIEIDLHPEFPKKGNRKLVVTGKILISKADHKDLVERRLHRLMDYCNLEIKDSKETFVSEDYEEYKHSKNRGKIIHWLPKEKAVDVEVVLENNTIIKGKGEADLKNVKEGDIVQFERFAFVRLVKKDEDKLTFWYLHK